jgi:prepilin-type N-terminal cleavage/methylation domain-containing protein
MRKSLLGFTLVEMVVAILIISVLSVVIYSLLPVSPFNSISVAKMVGNDIRYTQALAMYTGQSYYLEGTGANTYQIVNSAGTAILTARGTTTTTVPGDAQFTGITNLPNNIIGFNSRGAPITDTSGTALAATAVITVTSGASSDTITISVGTGNVTIQ